MPIWSSLRVGYNYIFVVFLHWLNGTINLGLTIGWLPLLAHSQTGVDWNGDNYYERRTHYSTVFATRQVLLHVGKVCRYDANHQSCLSTESVVPEVKIPFIFPVEIFIKSLKGIVLNFLHWTSFPTSSLQMWIFLPHLSSNGQEMQPA